MGVAAPVIEAEMKDWTSLGGGNSGIVGNDVHDYGFHRAANEIPSTDYSRQQDPNGSDGPYVNWNYCCAGDFSHKNNSKLRKMHVDVLNGLMVGKYPMICEFIGKPWSDKPVYYWARWNGIETLQKYTGQGHDTWSHVSWYRSKADKRAYLWIPSEDDMSELTAVSQGGLADLLGTDGVVESQAAAGDPVDTDKGFTKWETRIKRDAVMLFEARKAAQEALQLGRDNAAVLARIEAAIAAGPVPQPVKGTLSGPVTFTPDAS